MNSATCTHWRLLQPRYRLIGSHCEQCGQPTFPPRPSCPECAEPLSKQESAAELEEAAVVLLPLMSHRYVEAALGE